MDKDFERDIAQVRALVPGVTDEIVASARELLNRSLAEQQPDTIDRSAVVSHLEGAWRIADKPPWNSKVTPRRLHYGLLGNRSFNSWRWRAIEELERATANYFYSKGARGFNTFFSNRALLSGHGHAFMNTNWSSEKRTFALAATYELLRPAYARRFKDNPLKPLLYFTEQRLTLSVGYSQIRVTPDSEMASPKLIGEAPAWLNIRNYINGHTFPESLWSQPDKIRAHDIFRIANIERRRTLIEFLGYEQFLKKVNPEFLKKDKYGQVLKVAATGDSEDMVLVHVKDGSTPREYYLRVPPDFAVRTPKSAIAWTFRENSATYKPQVQT